MCPPFTHYLWYTINVETVGFGSLLSHLLDLNKGELYGLY